MTNANRDIRMMTLGYAYLLRQNSAVGEKITLLLDDPDPLVRKAATNAAVDILPNFPRPSKSN
jgi:hypothetical protein